MYHVTLAWPCSVVHNRQAAKASLVRPAFATAKLNIFLISLLSLPLLLCKIPVPSSVLFYPTMRVWLLLVAAFSQAMSQLLSDASGMSVVIFDTALPKEQSLALAGSDLPVYLASQPGSTPQSDPLGILMPGSATDLITPDRCVSPSPQTNPPRRTKRKLLRERQNVETTCPARTPSAGSISDESFQNPRLYPGGAKHRFTDWLFGNPQQMKQCPPEKQTLCCTGAQEGSKVRTCANCTLPLKRERVLGRRVDY